MCLAKYKLGDLGLHKVWPAILFLNDLCFESCLSLFKHVCVLFLKMIASCCTQLVLPVVHFIITIVAHSDTHCMQLQIMANLELKWFGPLSRFVLHGDFSMREFLFCVCVSTVFFPVRCSPGWQVCPELPVWTLWEGTQSCYHGD